MTTQITIKTGHRPVVLTEEDNINHGDKRARTHGWQNSQTFIAADSTHECCVTDTRSITVRECNEEATSLDDAWGKRDPALQGETASTVI